MPFYFDQGGTDRVSLQDFEPSFGTKFGAAVDESWAESLGPVAIDWFRKQSAKGPKLNAQEANDYINSFGFKTDLKAADGQYSQAQIDIMMERQRELIVAKDIRERTPWDLGSPVRGLAMFGAGVLDPLNLATAFIPWTWGISAARGLRAAQLSTSALTRFGGRAGLGAIDGGLSTAAIEPLYALARRDLGDDYDAYDSMANIAFGTAFGGGVVGLGGVGVDAFRKVTGRVAPSERFRGLSNEDIQYVTNLEKQIKSGMPENDIQQVLKTFSPEMRKAAGYGDPEVRTGKPSVMAHRFVEGDQTMSAISDAGKIRGTVDGNRLVVEELNVRERYEKFADSVTLLQRLADQAIDRGLDVASDSVIDNATARAFKGLQDEGFDVKISDGVVEVPPSPLMPNGGFMSPDDATPVFTVTRRADYVRPEQTAKDVVERVDPETREATMRAGIAQMVDGRPVDVDRIVGSDPASGGQATIEDINVAAAENQKPESLRVADFDASAKVDADNASAPKWDGLADAEQALNDADTQLNDTVSRGSEAYKYSRAAKESEQVDQLGFYSALQKAVDSIQQNKGSGDQFLAQLSKMPGVKPDEIKWTGLDDFLKGKKSVTKEEINEFLSRNRVEIRETVLMGESEPDTSSIEINWRNADVIDDYEYIDSRANDYLLDEESYFPGEREQIRERYIAERDLSEEDLQNDAIVERLDNDVQDEMYERASQMASDEYYENPYKRWSNDAGYEVFGNDDLGYTVTDPRGRSITPNRGLYDVESVEDLIANDAMDSGILQPEGDTKFSEWSLPGGTNYREVLMTLPVEQPNLDDAAMRMFGKRMNELSFDERQEIRSATLISTFESSHFDEKNILAHFRVKDRVDVDGKRMLFVEEIQSDWHQAGRKYGYSVPEAKKAISEEIKQKYGIEINDRTSIAFLEANNVDPLIIERWNDVFLKDVNRAPDAPFKTTWHELAVKRIIRMASEEGYERIGFTTAKTQIERYPAALRQLADEISWSRLTEEQAGAQGSKKFVAKKGGIDKFSAIVDKDGIITNSSEREAVGKQIDEVIGKSMASRIVAEAEGRIKGEEFAIGGKGMEGFYDNILPKFLTKYGKKWDAEVGTTKIPTEGKKTESVWKIDVTPQMVESAVSEGQPLFARGGKVAPADNLYQAINQSFGRSSDKLLESGQIKIVNKTTDLPGGPHPADAKGMTAPDGTVYIVAENVSQGEVKGIVLHEVGVHVGMEKMLGTPLFNQVLSQLDEAIILGKPWAKAARDAVPADTMPQHIREEQLAYLVQNSPELPIVKRIIAAVRAWAYRTFEFARERMTLTEDDFRALAIAALKYTARTELTPPQFGNIGTFDPSNPDIRYSRGETQDPSASTEELKSADAALRRAKQYADVLRAAADKLDDDAMAVSAMRAALPDITAEEIDQLLSGLRKQVKGMRNLTRATKEALSSGEKVDELQSQAMQAADMLANNLAMAAVIARRGEALDLNARLKASTFLEQFRAKELDFDGFAALLVGSERVRFGSRVSVDAEYKGFRGEDVGGLIADMEKAGLNRGFISGVFDRDIYDALWRMGQDNPDMTGLSPQAIEMANIVNKYQTNSRNRRNRFGAWIRDLQGYITRQSHDMFKIRNVTDDEWINFVKDRIDMPKMMRLGLIDETNPIGSLRRLYDDFASGIHMKGVAGEEDVVAFRLGANLAKRESVSRALYFKDGVSAYEYNEQFGTGRLAESVIHGLDHAARSAALLKTLGRNPEATLTRLMDEYENSLTDSVRRYKFAQDRGKILNLLSYVDGTTNIPGNVTAAKIGGFVRSWQSMAKLGGALISSFSDLAGYAAELRYSQDKNLLSGVADGIGALLKGRPKGEQAEVLASLGVFHESVAGGISARFDNPDLVNGKMAAAMQQFFRLNGLTWWTETLRDGAALSHSHYMAMQAKKSFANIDPEMRRLLGVYKIDEGKWELMRMATMQMADGRAYMTPEALRTIPRFAYENYITSVGRTASDITVQNLMDDLSQTLRLMAVDRAHHAVIEPSARTRAWMLRGTKPGTIPGELLRYIGQFKSFSVAMVHTVLGREVYGRGYDTVGEYLRKGRGDMLGMAAMIGMYGILGYASMSIKDLIKGREPRDPLDPKTMMAALAQGGGLGLYGDFLFGEYSRFGRSFTSSLAGPALGQLDALTDLWTRIRNGDDVAAASFKTLLENTPFMNLFWIRPILDYLVIWNIQESLNPGYLRRMERTIENQNNQKFIIRPSEVVR